jgi:hypothetical protein
MWQRIGDLRDMRIGARDGEIGRITDVYFDDAEWTVRYLVADTGGWLSNRKVLITPFAVQSVDLEARRIAVRLSRDQVRASPDIDVDKPVDRQHEMRLFDHYGYPYYWSGPFLWGGLPFPDHELSLEQALPPSHRDREREHFDPHLRSASAVSGYRIEATDGVMGQVEDFLYDPSSWSVRYLVLDTGKFLPGRHVLVATSWVQRVNWANRRIHVELSREAVRSSPEFDTHDLASASSEHPRTPTH